MRLLVVSDSHGNDGTLFKAHGLAGSVEAVIHTGDGEQDAQLLALTMGVTVLRVAGNCDHGSTAPRELLVTLAGRQVLITHGDRYGVKAGLEPLIAHGRELGAELILFGHTHQALTEQRHGIHLLNPGTLWGRAPFLSYAILDLTPDGILTTIHRLE